VKAPRLFITGFLLGTFTVSVQVGLSLADFSLPARSVAVQIQQNEELVLKPATLTITKKPSKKAVRITKSNTTKTSLKTSFNAALTKPSSRTAILPVLNQPTIKLEHQKAAQAMLDMLPAGCANNLKNFYVRYDNPTQRGLAGKSTVILSGNVAMKEFIGLLSHEAMGHFYDLGCLTGTASSGQSDFRDGADPIYNDDPSVAFYSICFTNAHTKNGRCDDTDFVSGYAKTDAFEFAAESIAYYLLQPDVYRERAKKSPIMDEQLKWLDRYAPTKETIAIGSNHWDGANVPWDVTRLPYSLKIVIGMEGQSL
jgi:hypothetical protein